MSSEQERFWKKVDIRGPDECWKWLASNNGAYGCFSIRNSDGKLVMRSTHRLSYEWANGPIAEGLHILHRCDNPLCVNPKHLFTGMPIDNITDSINKGRFARGEMKSRAKLCEADVERIRESVLFGATQRFLASVYGVTPSVICTIVSRKSWAHSGV